MPKIALRLFAVILALLPGLSARGLRGSHPARNRKFADSPLERTGFELPVPRWRWLRFQPSRRSPVCLRSDAPALRVPRLPIMITAMRP